MLRRYGKAGVLVLAVVILAFEAYLTYRWYDRYYGYEPSSGTGDVTTVAQAPDDAASGTDRDPKDTEQVEPAGDVFRHTATDGNSRGDYTYVHDPRIDGDPNAVVLAVPYQEGAEDAAYGRNIGVWYEARKERWAIFNQDLAPVPAGTSFRVRVPPERESFVHRADAASIWESATYLDHQLINGRPDADVSVTQNWNPGGKGSVYNDHPVDVFYDRSVDRWAVYNEDGATMPEGAAFNIFAPR